MAKWTRARRRKFEATMAAKKADGPMKRRQSKRGRPGGTTILVMEQDGSVHPYKLSKVYVRQR